MSHDNLDNRHQPPNQLESLKTFVAKKAEFDTLLTELRQASEDHFDADPEAVLWAEVTWLTDATEKLRQIADAYFRRGEFAVHPSLGGSTPEVDQADHTSATHNRLRDVAQRVLNAWDNKWKEHHHLADAIKALRVVLAEGPESTPSNPREDTNQEAESALFRRQEDAR